MTKESIYKVGDKVKIPSEYPAGLDSHSFPFSFTENMLSTCGGKIATITKVSECHDGNYNRYNRDNGIDPSLFDGYKYFLDIDDGRWAWSAPMFEQQFIIKAGMLVEYQSGDRQIVCPDSDGILNGIGLKYSPLIGSGTTSIVAYFATNETAFDQIVKIGWPSGQVAESLQFKEVLWEYKKPEPTIHEVTLQDIAAKFGIPVDELRIKD